MTTAQPTPKSRRQGLVGTMATGAMAIAAAAVLSACQPTRADAEPGAAEPPPLPSVAVARARAVAVDGGPMQVARVLAAQQVDLQSRVSGPVEAVLFTEGQLVRAGQPLFQIDPRTFDAALARARAELQLARAREAVTTTEADRARELHAEQAMAAEELERRLAAHAEAQARRAAAEAALQTAQLERDFTLVRSPITGRIGRALVTPGHFISAGNHATALATIVGVDPLHVHIDVADRDLLQQLGADRSVKGWKARIFDAQGERELVSAPIDFANHSIDAATGTVRLRARVDTPPPHLMPGQYVRVRLATGEKRQSILVPDQALGTDQGRRFVLVVTESGAVEYRPVVTGAAVGTDRIVVDGLLPGEQVIASGLMRVRPGMTVRPQAVDAPAASAGKTAHAAERS